jgi:hypothetical protein
VVRKLSLASADAVVIATLLAAAVVIAWPILGGGYLTYIDNPVHLAEIYGLAHEAQSGWSELAFCGFPIGTLHSPLWYGTLGAAARGGAPAVPLYTLLLLMGFVAPPLALYAVARRHLGAVAAGVLAYVLLVQRPAAVGVGAALAGMWTFYVAVGAFVLLADRLARGPRRYDLVCIAGLVGFILLTHLFLLIPLALLALIHVWRSLASHSRTARELGMEATAGLVGVAAAAVYWMPMALSMSSLYMEPLHLRPDLAVARLLLATDVVELYQKKMPALSLQRAIESVPMLLLVAAGVAGGLRIKRRNDDLPFYGFALAVCLLFFIVILSPLIDAISLGPLSWRLLYVVRVVLALAAIPAIMALQPSLDTLASRLSPVTLAVAAVFLGVVWGATLRAVTPAANGQDVRDLRALWKWMATNRSDEWGRVYLQDTFMTPPASRRLVRSHVLALTANETGSHQLGAWYGVVPFKTQWTRSEFGMLYEEWVLKEEHVGGFTDNMEHTNATHVLTSEPGMAAMLDGTVSFEIQQRSGRFALLHRVGAVSNWAVADGGQVDAIAHTPGRIHVRTGDDFAGGTLLVKTSYHPFWHIEGPSAATIAMEKKGLIHVAGVPGGAHDLHLSYRAPWWPKWLSLTGLLGIVALGVRRRG